MDGEGKLLITYFTDSMGINIEKALVIIDISDTIGAAFLFKDGDDMANMNGGGASLFAIDIV